MISGSTTLTQEHVGSSLENREKTLLKVHRKLLFQAAFLQFAPVEEWKAKCVHLLYGM